MEALKPYQPSFFEANSVKIKDPVKHEIIEQIPAPQNLTEAKSNEPKRKYYTVRKGSPLYGAPLGMGSNSYIGTAEQNIIGIVTGKMTVDGITSFRMVVESPAEKRGDVIWANFSHRGQVKHT